MAYTTVLEMLDLAGIPLRSAERASLTPLVFAGGSVCCNSEPMADFFDLMIIGEGESVDGEVLQLLREAKAAGWSKAEFLRRAALIGGVYVPSSIRRSITATARSRPCTPRRCARAHYEAHCYGL